MTNLPETDLVKLAEREVIAAAKAWVHDERGILGNTLSKLNDAVYLLESRERQRDQLYDPEHWNPMEGGNPL